MIYTQLCIDWLMGIYQMILSRPWWWFWCQIWNSIYTRVRCFSSCELAIKCYINENVTIGMV